MEDENIKPSAPALGFCSITELLALREYHLKLADKHQGDDARVKRDRLIVHHIDGELFHITNHILQIDNYAKKL